MLKKQLRNRTVWIEILLLVLVTCLGYLPNLSQATIFRDDWYYTMDGLLAGPGVFQTMFSIDRPARGLFFQIYFQLFGINPAPYHIASFIWRLLMGLAAVWFLYLLWPKRRHIAFWMTLLFVLYPGYTRWMEGFENQPKVFALFLMMLSFAMTLKAIQETRPLPRTLLWLGSILSGLGNLFLIDYAIGMEVFRFFCVAVYVNRDRHGTSLLEKCLAALHAWWPSILIPGIFLVWRLFFFHNARTETDIGIQVGRLAVSPLRTLANWVIHFFQSLTNEVLIAWAAPYGQHLFEQRLRVIAIGLAVVTLTTLCMLAGGYLLQKIGPREDDPLPGNGSTPTGWQIEAIGLGLVGVVFGVLPIIVANRYVGFGAYSHYSLPASIAAAILVVGFVGLLKNYPARALAVTGLVMLAVLNQYSASYLVLLEEKSVANFWHQAAWRMPQIQPGTTLVVNYYGFTYGEDVDAVNGPANLIYYPQPTGQIPVLYRLNGTKQYDWSVKEFLAGGSGFSGYRTHYGLVDYGNILVMTQSDPTACVHVIDSRWPWFAYDDRDQMMLMGPSSRAKNISTTGSPPKLDSRIFGREPSHRWCYYFEQAELAAEASDWNKVVEIAKEVDNRKLHPADTNRLELMPFLQAYGMVGDLDAFDHTVSRMRLPAYNTVQMCNALSTMQKNGYTFPRHIKEYIDSTLCK
ncbi:MAG TPA: hypothetical protein VMT46_12170 [Anaerolineaceae bacterium]|nr:hypothetical protein [Anaerolineaceae bacterium]